MEQIKSIFLNKKKDLQKKSLYLDDATIFHVFTKVISDEYGQQGAKSIVPEYYKEHTIFISFKHSIWAQEVWMRRDELMRKVNEKLGKRILYQIKVKN